jgi:hypothetical protein
MAFTPFSPITGGPQSGLTSPTYTITAGSPPANNAKSYFVSTLGGTQTGVLTHSVASPFTVSFWKPAVLKTLQPVNPVTGQLRAVPTNTYKMIVRKGVVPLAGQASRIAQVTVLLDVPAGSETYDWVNLRAMLSCAVGALWEQSSTIGATLTNGEF